MMNELDKRKLEYVKEILQRPPLIHTLTELSFLLQITLNLVRDANEETIMKYGKMVEFPGEKESSVTKQDLIDELSVHAAATTYLLDREIKRFEKEKNNDE